jgi:cysteine desulfuration protein SufE
MSAPDLAEITENMSFLDDWEDRYRYVIDIGKALPPLDDALKSEANKVQGCASQVWLQTDVERAPTRLRFRGDSDALIVRGLVAIMIAMHDGKTPAEIAALDPMATFEALGLKAHLSPQRSNGLSAMMARMKRDAAAAAG